MARKGKEFEEDYKWLYELDKEKYIVKNPEYVKDKVTGQSREIDVLIKYTNKNGILKKVAVECRDRKAKQNVKWIEELPTRRKDLGLDNIIAASTSGFTKPAIIKAKKNKFITEIVERINDKTPEELKKDYFIELYFLKIQLNKLYFIVNGEKILYKDFLLNHAWLNQDKFEMYLNDELCYNDDPREIIDNNNVSIEWLYDSLNPQSIKIEKIISLNNTKSIFNEFGIEWIIYEIEYIPFKHILPINKSISTFTPDRRNKDYKVRYGTDEEYIEMGYISNKSFGINHNLKEKEYRCIGSTMHLNTIFPKINSDEINKKMRDVIFDFIGKLDFKKVR